MLQDPYQKKRALIVVRTYPTPAKKGVEVSCTAAIDKTTGGWLRLFPVPYRFLPEDKRFRKYQWIDVDAQKSSGDARPESYKIRGESINIISEPLSTARAWSARKEWVYPLMSGSLCQLQAERDRNFYPTLGIFKPKNIQGLLIEPTTPDWSPAQLDILRQKDLFEQGPEEQLHKVPYTFKYIFRCDEPACSGHKLSCMDWEMGESWRTWSQKYGEDWEGKFRQTYEDEMINQNDTHFFVGTVHQHPDAWIIVGLFYPPKDNQGMMFL